MKLLIISAMMAFMAYSAEIINNNLLDGPNNVVEYGEGNQVHGRDNVLGGYKNGIIGDTNDVHGYKNGVEGHDNKVDGIRNFVSGEGNKVRGQGNIVIGPQASPQQVHAMQQLVQQRIMNMLAHRNLQAYY